MRRPICAFIFCTGNLQAFSRQGPYWKSIHHIFIYHKCPKYLDKQQWKISVDPDKSTLKGLVHPQRSKKWTNHSTPSGVDQGHYRYFKPDYSAIFSQSGIFSATFDVQTLSTFMVYKLQNYDVLQKHIDWFNEPVHEKRSILPWTVSTMMAS